MTHTRIPSETWPDLPLAEWSETHAALHLCTQIVGKVRLTCSPWLNHSWHATLYVSARGLTTSPMALGTRTFEIEFDFIAHQLAIRTSDGLTGGFALEPRPVASFYAALMAELERLSLPVAIHPVPNEVVEAIRFDRDTRPRPYDAEYAHRFWRVLVQVDRVFKRFRSGFIGKCSPVHFFWGAPDLAVTRFSGRRAPQHPGGIPNLPDRITREAYSHEVSSCGFWAGSGPIPYPAFYAYAYPEPEGFAQAPVQPAEAFYSQDYHEFVLPYHAVRASSSPDDALLAFLQSTYETAATLGHWERDALERSGD